MIEQPAPTRAPSPQPPRYSYSRPNYEPYEQPEQPVAHYEAYEPEQPADIPVVVGSYNIPLKTTTTTTPPPRAPTQPSYYYEEIDIITAPPIGGHRHYGNTYEVQVSCIRLYSFCILQFLNCCNCRLEPISTLEHNEIQYSTNKVTVFEKSHPKNSFLFCYLGNPSKARFARYSLLKSGNFRNFCHFSHATSMIKTNDT